MKRVKVKELVPGMITAEDVYSYNGQLILPKGLTLTDKVITRLEFYSVLSIRVEDEVAAVEEENLPSMDVSLKPPHSQLIKQSKEFQEFHESFDREIASFKNSINDIVELNSPIDTDSLLQNTKELIKTGASGSYSTMDMLHNMRQYDDLTFAHSMNVALICNVFAGWLGWSDEEKDLVTLCGLLHDLGKLKIPDSIIKKPAKLTDQEYSVVKTHTIEGYQILKSQNVNVHILNSALMHHEKCDGSGYPLGLPAEKIDKYAKVVAIVDVYDAMTSARVYRGPLCPFRVIELYEQEGLQKYDAHFIMTFLENVVNTYLHNDCILSDGRKGTIVFCNRNHLSKPIVQCGNTMVDLSQEHDLHVDQII